MDLMEFMDGPYPVEVSRKCSMKKVFLETAKFTGTGKYLCQSLSFKKIAGVKPVAQVF